jgi:uncharacterized membrane protein (DUF4010 family)
MNEFNLLIPSNLSNFVLVTVFSLLIGLSQRKFHKESDEKKLVGTDRTFTFIGILAYILLLGDPVNKYLYMIGMLTLVAFFVVFYYQRIVNSGNYGLTTLLIALITYSLPLLLISQPLWMSILVVVTVLIFTELKESLVSFTARFDQNEFLTLAKFLIIIGVILPIVPNTPLVEYLSITPYKIWLAVVAISSISYLSYLLRKFVFVDSGIMVTGILGGLYSSTATTFVLSKRMKIDQAHALEYTAAILLATSMMYLRILLLAFIFSKELFSVLSFPLIFLFVLSVLIAFGLKWFSKKEKMAISVEATTLENPLEFKIALVFTVLYLIFSFATYFAIETYGQSGLTLLSVIVGVTDIDPFLMNLFQGKYLLSVNLLAVAALTAMVSNNLVKMLYALFISRFSNWKFLTAAFLTISLVNLILLLTLM